VSGDRPPFDELYREFLPRIYAYVRVQLGDQSDAEDITAQVFVNAFRAYRRFEPRAATPAAWLFRIARNACLDHFRKAQRRQRAERALSREPVPEQDAGRLVEDRLLYRELLEAVTALPPRQREAISLRHGSGLSFQEVGELMGCSEDAAKMLYHRGLKTLREGITEAERT
jgi:RNA polymerase sigma-70 factor (ECF subfamily)